VKNAVFWDVMMCGTCKNRVLAESIASTVNGKNQRAKNVSSIVPSSLILSTLMMEVINPKRRF
jgi:phospholipid N-methyltransferase